MFCGDFEVIGISSLCTFTIPDKIETFFFFYHFAIVFCSSISPLLKKTMDSYVKQMFSSVTY